MPLVIDQFDDWVEYVPDIAENRLEQEPMTVEIQGMTTGEYKAVQRKWGPKLQGKQALGRAQRMVEKIVLDHVRNVRLCKLHNHDTGEIIDIKTAEQLLEHAPPGLIDDIFNAIVDASHLSAGLKKKSSSQSDSSAAEIRPSGGTAKPASGRAPSKPTSPAEKPFDGSETASKTPTPTLLGDLTAV